MMHVCNPALRLRSAVHHTPGWLAVGDVAANRKTHTHAGIPPPPQPGTESSSGETEDHSNATRGNGAVEECAKVVQVQEPNAPLKKMDVAPIKTGYSEGNCIPTVSFCSGFSS